MLISVLGWIFIAALIIVVLWISFDSELFGNDEFEEDVEELLYELAVEKEAKERLEKFYKSERYSREL